jgi:hypothetical protein
MTLRRAIGGAGVMREQLAKLNVLMTKTNITVQVIPTRTPAHAGLVSGFTVMTFEEGGDVAHVEGVSDTNQFINDPRTVNRIVQTYDLIRSVALPIEDSALLIKEIQESL